MKDDQRESNGLNREEYAAPDYRRLLFETSDLMQDSDANWGGYSSLGGDYGDDVSGASSAFGGGNTGW